MTSRVLEAHAPTDVEDGSRMVVANYAAPSARNLKGEDKTACSQLRYQLPYE